MSKSLVAFLLILAGAGAATGADTAGGLAKGVNVLAIELHRSDYHPVAIGWWQDRSARLYAAAAEVAVKSAAK